ncbi:MAG: SDR family oxidoreductase [Lysobacterales bacterium]|jgi:NAD(P)-dependent dehydrogenase (short-subunit alcohol dehydrogenase family)
MTARTVLVTAGGSGIGRGIAEAFQVNGDRVHICDISRDVLDVTLAENPGMRGSVADVSDIDALERLIEDVKSWGGPVDVLVNNAGIAGPIALAEDVSTEEWDRTINVNLNSMFYLVRLVLPEMKQRKIGCIINISSCSARVGMTRRLPYVASKVGVLGFNYALAREVGAYGVRVNAILPGAVYGDRCKTLLAHFAKENSLAEQEAEKEFLRYTSMKTWIQPSEIGSTAVFLASDSARHITGQELSVDGLIEWEE